MLTEPSALPVSGCLPVPLDPDTRDTVIDNMSAAELRSALRWMAGAAPRDFAGAVWAIERQRESRTASQTGTESDR